MYQNDIINKECIDYVVSSSSIYDFDWPFGIFKLLFIHLLPFTVFLLIDFYANFTLYVDSFTGVMIIFLLSCALMHGLERRMCNTLIQHFIRRQPVCLLTLFDEWIAKKQHIWFIRRSSPCISAHDKRKIIITPVKLSTYRVKFA
jgi:hypothetical protein